MVESAQRKTTNIIHRQNFPSSPYSYLPLHYFPSFRSSSLQLPYPLAFHYLSLPFFLSHPFPDLLTSLPSLPFISFPSFPRHLFFQVPALFSQYSIIHSLSFFPCIIFYPSLTPSSPLSPTLSSFALFILAFPRFLSLPSSSSPHGSLFLSRHSLTSRLLHSLPFNSFLFLPCLLSPSLASFSRPPSRPELRLSREFMHKTFRCVNYADECVAAVLGGAV